MASATSMGWSIPRLLLALEWQRSRKDKVLSLDLSYFQNIRPSSRVQKPNYRNILAPAFDLNTSLTFVLTKNLKVILDLEFNSWMPADYIPKNTAQLRRLPRRIIFAPDVLGCNRFTWTGRLIWENFHGRLHIYQIRCQKSADPRWQRPQYHLEAVPLRLELIVRLSSTCLSFALVRSCLDGLSAALKIGDVTLSEISAIISSIPLDFCGVVPSEVSDTNTLELSPRPDSPHPASATLSAGMSFGLPCSYKSQSPSLLVIVVWK